MPTTHKPASPTSIHSYVSVRPARKIAAEAEEQHFCVYDADHVFSGLLACGAGLERSPEKYQKVSCFSTKTAYFLVSLSFKAAYLHVF